MKRSFVLLLTMLMILGSVVAVSATPSRITVYQEDFEEGVGKVVAQATNETFLYRQQDENGNDYVMLRLNPDKAANVATFTFSKQQTIPGGDTYTVGGRWGTEFYTWAIQLNHNFNFQNDKNYQFMFDGSYSTDGVFAKPTWGTSVLLMAGNTIWRWEKSNSTTYTAMKEVFISPTTGTAISGKAGWFDCYTAATWLDSITYPAYRFGTTAVDVLDKNTQFTGASPMSYYHVRTNLGTALAEIMAANKFYCGKGTGFYGISNNVYTLQTAQPWGGGYKFTLTREDFYGDEAIFADATTEEERNAIKDSYIYENGTDGTKREYSLGGDCSFLYSLQRIAAFKAYLEGYQVGYAMDNLRIVADSYEYTDTVSVTGNGSVSALTNPATKATTVVNSGKSKAVTKNDYFGVAYTIVPAEGYSLESVMYGETDMTGLVNAEGVLTVAASSVTANETMNVTFASDEPVAPKIVKAATVETGDYTTESGTVPAAVLYLQVSAGTDGSTIQQTGTLLREDGYDNSLSLVAKNVNDTDFNQAGFFGIRVFGKAFKGGTYYFKPFVTYEDGEGASQTTYEEDETSFTLGSE